jgi:hypothetical protein
VPSFVGHDVASPIVKAGRRLDLHPEPSSVAALRAAAAGRVA